MLSQEQIESNKRKYLDLITSINVEGSDIERLVNWLEKSDFFTAPASTKYHCAYPGGLCEHSLNVYYALVKLVDTFASHLEFHESEDGKMASEDLVNHYSPDTVKIVALMHDISKANFYETYFRNVKDDSGKWIQVQEYRTKEAKDRFVYGNHEQNSEFIAHTFFPLTVEESCAILHHHGGMGFDSTQADLTPIYNKYSLACLLHTADLIACYTMEKI